MTIDPRAQSLAHLFDVFPSGISDAQRVIYLEIVQREGISDVTLKLAVERIINTRKVSTTPKPAELLERCREIRREQAVESGQEKVYSLAEARALAERRLKYINNVPNAWNIIPITPETIDLHLEHMRRVGFRVADD